MLWRRRLRALDSNFLPSHRRFEFFQIFRGNGVPALLSYFGGGQDGRALQEKGIVGALL